jgi:hypothetical protein
MNGLAYCFEFLPWDPRFARKDENVPFQCQKHPMSKIECVLTSSGNACRRISISVLLSDEVICHFFQEPGDVMVKLKEGQLT